MKYIYLLIVGVLTVLALPTATRSFQDKNIKQAEIATIEPVSEEIKAETVKVAIEAEKAPEWASLSLEEKLKANPQKCDLVKQDMWGDGSCHDKPVAKAESAPPATASKPVGSGSCEDAIRRIFPANQHQNAIRIMLQESSGIPDRHNWNPKTGDDSWGCFQINLAGENKKNRPSPSELVNADINVRFAYNLWKSTGWRSSGGWKNSAIKLGIY